MKLMMNNIDFYGTKILITYTTSFSENNLRHVFSEQKINSHKSFNLTLLWVCKWTNICQFVETKDTCNI